MLPQWADSDHGWLVYGTNERMSDAPHSVFRVRRRHMGVAS